MKSFCVTIPIAGHIYVNVEAENKEQALSKAYDAIDAGKEDNVEWEMLDRFIKGNVCYCPNPWQIEIEDEGDIED
jgi:hypothetical protein